MKVLVRFLFVSMVVAMVAGCASNTVYIPKIPPCAQAKLLDYFEQPDHKAFVIAIDPSGDFAFGYDYGKPTQKDALKVATKKCDASRNANGVLAKPYIYALDDEVVYEDVIKKMNQSSK